jgi:FkbM family methyltransferase
MRARHYLVSGLVKPYVQRELPGWGRVYDRFVGGYRSDGDWQSALPRVIRDKRYGLLRLVDLREWADRSLFFLDRWYDLEAQLVLDLILRDGDTVVDAGANYGHFALAAAALVGTTGSVIAIEPNPRAFARLQTHIDLNRLQTMEAWNVGLSDAPGQLALSVPPVNSGEASFAGSKYADARTVTCPVVVGDERIGGRRVACIKIDVEGFEMRVLRGFRRTIERDRPWILTEVVDEHLRRDGASGAALDSLLRPLGYTPMRLALAGRVPWNKRLSLRPFDPARDEGDVLWVPEGRKDVVAGAVVS